LCKAQAFTSSLNLAQGNREVKGEAVSNAAFNGNRGRHGV
jgi:hypothetical protein